MKLPGYSLRIGIIAQLTVLIVAAMLLINVVMIKFAERDLIRARIHTGQVLLRAIQENLSYQITHGRNPFSQGKTNPRFLRKTLEIFEDCGFSDIYIIDSKGKEVFSTQWSPRSTQWSRGSTEWSRAQRDRIIPQTKQAALTGSPSVRFFGTTWSVIWLGKKYLTISAPLTIDGQSAGAMTIMASLETIYKDLRQSEKIILLYIVLDTLILLIGGMYLLARLVVRPIQRLVKLTEQYGEEEIVIPFQESSKNEIAKLSRSLGMMLRRLGENKKELQAHIDSLQSTNEKLKRAQRDLIRSEKLASVGRLAAGIAHEIGNPIGIILGYLELIRKNDIKSEDRNDYLLRIEEEISRINQIIRNLLDFSRPVTSETREVHVHELIDGTLKILEPQPGMTDVDISLELDASRDTVFVDPDQLRQVFVNIIMNASDALEQKMTTKPESVRKTIAISSRNRGEMFELSFADNGPGITEDELGKIYDPFYTTKEPGKGTGLGLSVSFRIIESFGGALETESEPGKGTVFRIKLPVHVKKPEHPVL